MVLILQFWFHDFFSYFAGRTVKMVWNSTQTPPTFSSFGGKRCSKTRREWCTIEAKRYHTYFPYEVQIYLVFWVKKNEIFLRPRFLTDLGSLIGNSTQYRFFWHPDFTWNQFWSFWSPKNCHFVHLRNPEFWIFGNFWHF